MLPGIRVVIKDTFISEVEFMRSEMLESEVVIEGEYASVQTMREWGFSEPFSSSSR